MPPKTNEGLINRFLANKPYVNWGLEAQDGLRNDLNTLLTTKDKQKEEAIAEARREAYQHAEIVRQRSLNELREELESK